MKKIALLGILIGLAFLIRWVSFYFIGNDLLFGIKSGAPEATLSLLLRKSVLKEDEIKEIASSKYQLTWELSIPPPIGDIVHSSFTEEQKARISKRFVEVSFHGESGLLEISLVNNKVYSTELHFRPYNEVEAKKLCSLIETGLVQERKMKITKESDSEIPNAIRFSDETGNVKVWCNFRDRNIFVSISDQHFFNEQVSEHSLSI